MQATYAPVVSSEKALHDDYPVRAITEMCFDPGHQMVSYKA